MAHYIRCSGTFAGDRYKSRITYPYFLSIPDVPGPHGLVIDHDWPRPEEEETLLRLAEQGKAPYCVCLCVVSGDLALPDGTKRNTRLNSYDLFTSEFGDFLRYELIPALTERHHLTLSPDPDRHAIVGCSSGGISAFTAAWFHSDYFHRVYMASPTFSALGRGYEVPVFVRKSEGRPLRVYLEYSENEPDDYFGNSLCAAMEIERALAYAHYDYQSVYYPGEGHGSRYQSVPDMESRLTWLWQDYALKPIQRRSSSRVNEIVSPDSQWERTDRFPSAPEKPCLTILSSDNNFLYRGAPDQAYCTAQIAGQPGHRMLHGMLHTIADMAPVGALDLALDEENRLYVLTAAGIQCVRSFGPIDVILDLPDRSKPLRLAFGNDEKRLYLKTESGIWARSTCCFGISDRPKPAGHTGYYD